MSASRMATFLFEVCTMTLVIFYPKHNLSLIVNTYSAHEYMLYVINILNEIYA